MHHNRAYTAGAAKAKKELGIDADLHPVQPPHPWTQGVDRRLRVSTGSALEKKAGMYRGLDHAFSDVGAASPFWSDVPDDYRQNYVAAYRAVKQDPAADRAYSLDEDLRKGKRSLYYKHLQAVSGNNARLENTARGGLIGMGLGGLASFAVPGKYTEGRGLVGSLGGAALGAAIGYNSDHGGYSEDMLKEMRHADRYYRENGKHAFEGADRIPGGPADHLSIKDFDPKQLRRGQLHEMEHTTDPAIAREIASDHLTEHPRYYEKRLTKA